MNKIYGRIILEETGVGIPDLLVVVYDVDPQTLPEELIYLNRFAIGLSSGSQGFPGDRIGSVLTDQNGAFEFLYEDEEFQIRNPDEKRPDLFLIVMSAEEFENEQGAQILYSSKNLRQNAGRSEQYLIQLKAEQLRAGGIDAPEADTPIETGPEKPENILARAAQAEEERLKLKDGFREIYAKRIARKQAIKQQFENTVKQSLLKSLSKVSTAMTKPETFISADEDAEAISKKTAEAIKVRIRDVVNKESSSGARAPVKGYVTLTEEQAERLRDAGTIGSDGHISDVPGAEFEALFARAGDNTERPTYFLQADPIARHCREKTVGEKCLDGDSNAGRDHSIETEGAGEAPSMHDENGAEEDCLTAENSEDTEPTGTGLEIDLTSDDGIPRYIASLVEQADPIFTPVAFGKKKRAKQNDIQCQIDQLSLRAGPADVTAFYDFHNLQIAFENIWQEAMDQGILKNAKSLYEAIVDLGGDPGDGSVDDLCDAAEDTIKANMQEPPNEVVETFGITKPQWNVLNEEHREKLKKIARIILESSSSINSIHTTGSWPPFDANDMILKRLRTYLKQLRQQGEGIIQFAQSKLDETYEDTSGDFTQFHNILKQLRERLKSKHSFIGFAAKEGHYSINFGLLLTYRQRWEPQTYQAGELVKTITLAPKEVRKFTKKTVRKLKRSEKEVENSLYSYRNEFNTTSRAEAEIVRNAQAKTNFNTTADGTFNTAVWNVHMQASFGTEASTNSNETKKDFHEAVHKAAEEYKQERKTEVNTEDVFEEEYTESGEIMNPNDELPVTFLFYELQRRYKVSERLNRVLPIVLVAQEIPNPADIDEDWIVTHDWILRRVLLDDSFIPALNYLTTKVVGDEFALNEIKKHLEKQQKTIDALKEEVVEYRELVGQRYGALERAIERSAEQADGEEESFLGGIVSSIEDSLNPARKLEELFTSDNGEDGTRVRERAARDAYEKAVQDEKEVMERLNRAIATHNAATEAYTKKLGEHLNRRAQILRLLVHIKENILYYMQAIWLHEPPDQRFLRLHKVEVPVFKGDKTYKFKPSPNISPYVGFSHNAPENNTILANPLEYEVDVNIDPDFETKPLVEVADLDNLLGFKGNYMIFRLQKSNVLTEFMMEPYINREWNTVYDPDVEGSMTLDEFSDFVCCLQEELEPEVFERIKPELNDLLGRLLTSPLRDNEEIVVPTDSLFIEALPGSHPILEDFKLMHRAIDVNIADAQHKEQVLENIRRTARLLGDEFEDPDIEAKYVFEGDGNATIVAPGPSGDD